MNQPPAFSFYVRDWFLDTADLDVSEEGAYIRLLAYSWVKRLPSNPGKLARIARVNTRRWNTIWGSISGFFECSADGFLTNPRQEEERRKSLQYREEQAAKGRKSGEQRRNRGSRGVRTGSKPEGNSSSASASSPAIQPLAGDVFEQAWKAYPKRIGGNPKTPALKAWNARAHEGEDPATLLAGTVGYGRDVRNRGKDGTEFVLMARTFYGPDRRYRDFLPPEPKPAPAPAPDPEPSPEERARDAAGAEVAIEEIRRLREANQPPAQVALIKRAPRPGNLAGTINTVLPRKAAA